MRISFEEAAWKEYLHWQKSDKKVLRKINDLIREIKRNPFHGIGKPEPLRFDLSGYWSRRINQEHRLVHKVSERTDEVIIIQCRYHY